MITREEAKDYINQVEQDLGFIDIDLVVNHLFDDFELRIVYLKHIESEVELLRAKHIKLEVHIKSLEAQLANTEQLSCDSSCYWFNTKGSLTQAYCPKCIRNDHMEDRYQPKDTQ